MRLFCVIIQLVLTSVISFALSPLEGRQIRHYTVNDGLASNAVYSFCQDSKGVMWLGTIDGLHSFDGYEIREWRDADVPTLGAVISCIMEDDRQRLWLGSGMGVALFDLRKERLMSVPINDKSGVRIKSPVMDIIQDSKGKIWLATNGEGVFCYDPDTEILKQYPANSKIRNDVVRAIMEDSSGVIWAGTQEGICRYNPEQDRFVNMGSANGQKIQVTALFEGSRHNLWVGSRGDGLFMLDRENDCLVQKLKPDDNRSLILVRAIVEWKPGQLLIASDQGLTCYDLATGETSVVKANPDMANSLNDNYLQSLYIDKEGALWIGTYFGGVNYVSPTDRIFTCYNSENTNLGAKVVSVFAKADDGNIWLGSDDAGVFYWDRSKNSFTPMRNHPLLEGNAHKNIHALLQDGDNLMVGMYLGGLNILDLKTNKVKNYMVGDSPNSLYSSSIYSIFKDSYGDVWIGTAMGLNRYRKETDDFERIFEVHPADVCFMIEDPKGFLWACTTNSGVYRLDRKTGKWEQFKGNSFNRNDPKSPPTNAMVTAAFDKKGNLWFGSDGFGLIRFDYSDNTFNQVELPEPIRVITRIIPDNGNLWLATTKGLYCYTVDTGVMYKYNKESGLQDNVFVPNSGIMTDEGTICVGGINGFNEFDPNKITHEHLHPEVILTDFQVFNRPVEIGADKSPLAESIAYSEGLELKHDQKVISFRVSPLSYLNPSQNRYLYKLEGFDKDWHEADPTYPHTYTNLQPGKYIFRVKTADGNGGWNDHALDFPIRVLPPWWKSTPMIVLYILLCIAVLWYVYRRIMLNQQEKLKKLADQKDMELYHSKMEFFTHMVHEIRTPLTLILSPLENLMKTNGKMSDCRDQLSVMQRNGQRLLTLVNRLMDFRKVESGGMKMNMTDIDLRDVVGQVCQNFILTAAIRHLNVTVDIVDIPCIAKVDKEAFRQIVDNLLSNALKFSHSEIHISLNKTEDGHIILSVRDNGPGISKDEQEKIFFPFYQVAENRPTDNIGTGLGLLLVKRYATLMNAEVSVVSAKGEGAEFIISFMESEGKPESTDMTGLEESHNNVAEGERYVMESSKEKILVVDDNEDMFGFLNVLLSTDYDVICVSSAKEALAVLKNQQPSLIVSDVMMPEIDGMTFCRSVKTDINTSHIPVVLLTAKVEDSDFVTGFESGADLYVTKPFSPEVMKAQIRSLLLNRARIRERFKGDPSALGEIVEEIMPSSSPDKEFFKKISDIVESHISEAEFSIDMLCQESGISRSALFSKLKSIAGVTPANYIQSIRLRKAAELLKTSQLQIGEVCWQVGFSSRAHFSRCFQAYYGVPPSEYRRKNCKSAC